MSEKQSKFSRRTVALLWVLAVGVVIAVLIAFELISVLYLLATIALVVLLLIVGFADLESVGRDDLGGFSAGKD